MSQPNGLARRLGSRGHQTVGACEMRVHVGPGYRVYFAQRHGAVLLLLCGGAKSSQARDIERARRIMAELDKG